MPDAELTPRLVDSSVWIRADRKGHDAIRGRLREFLVAGAVWSCWPIRVVLLVGVKTPERWIAVAEQLAALEQAVLTDESWELAARIGHQLARKGQRVPLADLVIAAVALTNHLPLWTVDSDFKRIAKVAPLELDGFGVM